MTKKTIYIIIIIIIQIISISLIAKYSFPGQADYGIDILADNNFDLIKGKRVAVLANKSSVNKDGKNIVDIFIDDSDINLVRIFSPEHGFCSGHSAGEKVANDKYKNIDIVSLYGSKRKPSNDNLKDIDVMVIDMQDVGSTYYTYMSTITYVLEAASKNDISVIVLDRPNPIGRNVYGPIKDKNYFNFIGMHPIPIRHGMTVGELSLMINDQWLDNKIKNLKVIQMHKFPKQKDFHFWIPPSPNIPDINTAFLYNGTCLFEGTNISEGRGTAHPFQWIGAPWIDSNDLVDYVQSLNYGLRINIEPIQFTPKSINAAKNPKYEDQLCNGVSINLHRSVEPIEFTLYLLEYFYETYDEFKFNETFDILYGSSVFRECLEKDCDIKKLIDKINQDINEFNILRERYLLY